MAGGPERDDEIDHGQPGAADQHGGIAVDAGIRGALPRIDVAGRAAARRLVVAGGEHRHVAGEASPVVDQDAHAVRRVVEMLAPFAIDDLEPPRLSGCPRCGVISSAM